MDKKYFKERIKLAFLYFLILAIIIAIYSVIIIQLQDRQFRRFEPERESRTQDRPYRPVPELTEEQKLEIEKIIAEVKRENFENILILDSTLLLLASFLAYYLSGKTLEPILATINKQKRFISDASHELKTPLTNMRTEAEVLNRSKTTTVEEYKEFTSNAISDIDRLNDLVNYLLEAAKFEDSKIILNVEEIDLSKFISEISDKFIERALQRSVRITFKSTPEGIISKTDKNLFERLLSVIIDNSIKYNKENGKIDLSLNLQENGRAMLSIKDTGIGIPESDLPRIFDRFYRVSEDRNEKGFGLGLAIARRLAGELNINVKVKSTLGEGTEFLLTI